MIRINSHLTLPEAELEVSAVRSQGAGGQNVNKVATAIQLRFDVKHSSLPDLIKQRLLSLPDQRLTKDGVWVVKCQEFRTQGRNLEAALQRLREFVALGTQVKKKRIATTPSLAARRRRMDGKKLRGSLKQSRKKVRIDT